MSRVTRRPYTDCPYRWSLTVDGVSGGAGVVSESQCTDLNGEFSLDFAPCLSKGGNLNWVGECDGGSGDGAASAACGRYRLDVSGVSGFDCADTYNGTFHMQSYQPDLSCDFCVYVAPRRSISDNVIGSGCDCVANTETTSIIITPYNYTFGGAWWFAADEALGCLWTDVTDLFSLSDNTIQRPVYRRAGGAFSDVVGSTITFTKQSSPAADCGTWPDEIVATRTASGGTADIIGPATGDRIRSKWHLSYDIAETLWTLRSFERIDYPIYTLVDSDPCSGETKTLVLSDRGMLSDGCGVAPAEVTITRACPPDREANSGLLEDRRINGATGKKKRQCSACDCQDEVADPRYTCGTKCTDNTTPGCESYTEEEAPCLYPKTTVCCDYCEGMDQPCAYIAEFECDIADIAARQVTLRQECPFDNTCEWVAVGPSSNAADGGVGAQPICATCSGTCPTTGCTWQTWEAGACP